MLQVLESIVPRRFEFQRDTFAFPNELVWEYRSAPDGTWQIERGRTSPSYAHRCFVLVRAARQFFFHARFEGNRPRLDSSGYRARIREVLRRPAWQPSARAAQVGIPGYADLRGFSLDWESLLKEECGGAWRSYFLRSHWRMVLPISRRHQAAMALQLRQRVQAGLVPVVHLVCFPRLTINHGMVLFAEERRADGQIGFLAYDPNNPAAPEQLIYEQARRTFRLPPNRYWPGGDLNVIEIYRSRWF